MNLLVIYPFHQGDADIAELNAEWIAELGKVSDFDCLIVTTTETNYAKIQRVLTGAFRSVEVLALEGVEDGIPPERRWPVCANRTFDRASRAAQIKRRPFLFLEPDAIPTRATWLIELNDAYKAHGLPFMGAVRDTWLRQRDGTLLHQDRHMVGMGVYPADFRDHSDLAANLYSTTTPFDIWLQGEIIHGAGAGQEARLVRGCFNTPLISHHWSTRNWRYEDGELKCDKDKEYAICDKPDLRTPAVAHGIKDGSAIKLMRGAKSPERTAATPQPYSSDEFVQKQIQAVAELDRIEALSSPALNNALSPDEKNQFRQKELGSLAWRVSNINLETKEGAIEAGRLIEAHNRKFNPLSGSAPIGGLTVEDFLSVKLASLPQVLDDSSIDKPAPSLPTNIDQVASEVVFEQKEVGIQKLMEKTDAFMQSNGVTINPDKPLSFEQWKQEEGIVDSLISSMSEEPKSLVFTELAKNQSIPPSADVAVLDQSDELVANIRADSNSGMPWRELLAKYRIQPKRLKEILNNPVSA